MRTRSKSCLAALVAVLVATLAGCAAEPSTEPGAESGTESNSEPSTSVEGETALLRALGEIDGPTDGYAEFGDAATLRELSEGRFAGGWADVRAVGAGSIAPYWMAVRDLGIDLSAADYFVSVGQAPGARTLILGGQREADIREAAPEAGWQGDDELTSELNMQQPLSVHIAGIAPDGADVLLTGRHAESARRSAADDPSVRAPAECLGDVLAAMISDGVGVGVLADAEGAPVAVYCVAGDERTASTVDDGFEGVSPSTGNLYAQYFPQRAFEVRGGYVRFELSVVDEDAVAVIFNMLIRRDLPGLP